jgi:spore coat protein U-like protein
MVRRFFLTFGPLLAAISMPTAAGAAPLPASPAVEGSVALMKPLTLKKLRDLDFGTLGVTTAGTAVVNPVTDALGVTGGVTALGGTPHSARFAGATTSSAVVNIKVPNNAVFITRLGGTETIRVDSFTLDGQSKRAMAQAGVFEFNVGATLRPAANQVEGVYLGTFEVTIQYP